MKKMMLGILTIFMSVWLSNGPVPVFAQMKVFLDAPKVRVAPQEIIDDSEFTSGEEDPAEETGQSENTESPAGRLRIDVTPGEVIQVPVVIQDGEEDVISYALRVRYTKNIFRVLDIAGGTFQGFAATPLTNRASFGTGKTDFTANNVTFQSTPDNFHIATISVEVIGKPKQKGTIAIRKTPKTDLTVLSTFGPARRVKFQKGITVRVK
jgi:hypothetical protein